MYRRNTYRFQIRISSRKVSYVFPPKPKRAEGISNLPYYLRHRLHANRCQSLVVTPSPIWPIYIGLNVLVSYVGSRRVFQKPIYLYIENSQIYVGTNTVSQLISNQDRNRKPRNTKIAFEVKLVLPRDVVSPSVIGIWSWLKNGRNRY